MVNRAVEQVGLRFSADSSDADRKVNSLRDRVAGLGSTAKGLTLPFLGAAALSGNVGGSFDGLSASSRFLDNQLLGVNKRINDVSNSFNGLLQNVAGARGVQAAGLIGSVVSGLLEAVGALAVPLLLVQTLFPGSKIGAATLAPFAAALGVALVGALALVGLRTVEAELIKQLNDMNIVPDWVTNNPIKRGLDNALNAANPTAIGALIGAELGQSIADKMQGPIITALNFLIDQVNKIPGVNIPKLRSATLGTGNPVSNQGSTPAFGGGPTVDPTATGGFGGADEHPNVDQGIPIRDRGGSVSYVFNFHAPINPTAAATAVRRATQGVINDPVFENIDALNPAIG